MAWLVATQPGEAGKMEPGLLPPDFVTAVHCYQPSGLAGTAREDLGSASSEARTWLEHTWPLRKQQTQQLSELTLPLN